MSLEETSEYLLKGLPVHQLKKDDSYAGPLPTYPATVTVTAGENAATNGQNLLDAYAEATALTPNGQALSEYNRVVLIIPPGFYEMPTSLTLTTPYVDFVGLTSNSLAQMLQPSADAVFGAIEGVSAGNGARFYNLSFRASEFVDNYGFNFDDSLGSSYFENCTWINNGESGTGMGVAVTIASTFFNCAGGHYSFGGGSGTFSGTATNCAGGNYSFGGGVSGECSGTVRDCIAGTNSFGGGGGTFSGTAYNCRAGNISFGGTTFSGIAYDCHGGSFCFAAQNTFSGTAYRCSGNHNSFGGGGGVFSGTAVDCKGSSEAFGGGENGICSGTLTNCEGGAGSFGGSMGEFAGIATNCTGGVDSFGGGGGTFSNTGRAAYCRLTSGSFPTPDGGGIIVLCVDGSWSEVNAAP